MTYRPREEFFGPPLRVRIVGYIHAGVAVLVALLVVLVERGPQDSELYQFMFRQKHLVDTHLAAGAFFASALFSILRDGMRGVMVRAGFIEYRELLSAVWPRVRRYRWAQIDALTFETNGAIGIDLWDGRREYLPEVRAGAELRAVLERLALSRAIPVSGGRGLDDLSEESEQSESGGMQPIDRE